MKKIVLTIGLLFTVTFLASAQDNNVDKKLSSRNYKHPDKAAKAKQLGVEEVNRLETRTVSAERANRNYKHKLDQPSGSGTVSVAPKTVKKSSRNYKHRFGI